MNRPYIPEDLLEVGDFEVVSNDNGCLVVDNWYKNFEDLYQVVTNLSVPRWKWKEGSRNFVDYYDCRSRLNINYPEGCEEHKVGAYLGQISQLMQNHFQEHRQLSTPNAPNSLLEFNFYKNINQGVSNSMQHYPHVDLEYNLIVFIDKVSSGGTALYRNIDQLDNDESQNLLMDISEYERTVIPAKPNRLVIFSGDTYHGGYIEDHNKYVKDWRITQITFLQVAGT